MSSRIFIRGLPSKFTDQDLRKHFEKTGTVTDSKFIPNRRIGYVGYKTAEDAEKAVKFFNNTFIRMSRIAVEIAKSYADQSLPRAWSAHTPGTTAYKRKAEGPLPSSKAAVEKTNAAKRKKTEVDPLKGADNDSKLREFLQVMQPQSSSKTWTNDDLALFNQQQQQIAEVTPVVQVNEEDDEDYVDLSKLKSKPEKSQRATEAQKPTHIPAPSTDIEMTSSEPVVTETPAGEEEEEKAAPEISDEDWLRAKTNRLLDLMDDEDVEMRISNPVPAPAQVPVDGTIELMQVDEDNVEGKEEEGSEAEQQPAQGPSEEDVAVQKISDSGRLFVRNLSYETTEEELQERFSEIGILKEVHIPVDGAKQKSKGFAYILYEKPEDAVQAYRVLDKTIFQGRLLHILPAAPKKDNKLDEFALSKLPLKKQREIKRKAAAASSQFNWNSMYMNADAVMSSVAARLGVSKSELLDPTSSDAAVTQAHAETAVIQETKDYFKANGVNLDTFGSKKKDDCVILIKNFPFGTTLDELKDLLKDFGPLGRVLMPPSGTIAIAEYLQAPHGRAAFASLAYRRFKESILFLEKAPKGIFTSEYDPSKTLEPAKASGKDAKVSAQELLATEPTDDSEVVSSSLYIRNLSFATTQEQLKALFKPLDGFMSAVIRQKPDPKNPGKKLSMGFGFVEFRTKEQAQAAMAAMNGHVLDGHEISIKASHQGLDAAEQRKKDEKQKKVAGTKLIIKNLPFEANKSDVQRLFGQYGKLRSVRMPKKFGGPSRGFAFADFVTAKDAQTAMSSLKDTHLLGRKLVIEPALKDAADAEEEIEKMTRKMEQQAGVVKSAKLRDLSKRQKFEIAGQGEDDM